MSPDSRLPMCSWQHLAQRECTGRSCLLGACISSFKQNGVHGVSLDGHFLLTGRSPVGKALNSHGGSLPRSGACRGTGWVKGAREQGEVLILFFSVSRKKQFKRKKL